MGARARGVAPDWLRKAVTKDDTYVDAEVHKKIIKNAGNLSYSELVVLLHRRVGAAEPYWFTEWLRKRYVYYAKDMKPSKRAAALTILAIAIRTGIVTPFMMVREEFE